MHAVGTGDIAQSRLGFGEVSRREVECCASREQSLGRLNSETGRAACNEHYFIAPSAFKAFVVEDSLGRGPAVAWPPLGSRALLRIVQP